MWSAEFGTARMPHLDQRRADSAIDLAAVLDFPRRVIGERVIGQRVVAVRRARITAVLPTEPEPRAKAILAVGVVPAREDDPAVVADRRVPLAGLEIAERDHVGTIIPHREHRVVADFQRRIEATDVSAAAFGDEGEAAVGQPTRIEVVEAAIGQLAQLRAIRGGPEHVKGRFLVETPAVFLVCGPGKRDRAPVGRKIGSCKRAMIQSRALQAAVLHHGTANDVDHLRLVFEISNAIEPAAGQRVAAEVLGREMPALRVGRGGIRTHGTGEGAAGHAEDLGKVQQWIGERELAAQRASREVAGTVALRIAGGVGLRDILLQFLKVGGQRAELVAGIRLRRQVRRQGLRPAQDGCQRTFVRPGQRVLVKYLLFHFSAIWKLGGTVLRVIQVAVRRVVVKPSTQDAVARVGRHAG